MVGSGAGDMTYSCAPTKCIRSTRCSSLKKPGRSESTRKSPSRVRVKLSCAMWASPFRRGRRSCSESDRRLRRHTFGENSQHPIGQLGLKNELADEGFILGDGVGAVDGGAVLGDGGLVLFQAIDVLIVNAERLPEGGDSRHRGGQSRAIGCRDRGIASAACSFSGVCRRSISRSRMRGTRRRRS